MEYPGIQDRVECTVVQDKGIWSTQEYRIEWSVLGYRIWIFEIEMKGCLFKNRE